LCLPSIRSRRSRGVCRSIRIHSGPVIGHVSDIAVVVVGSVGNVLGATIRESNRIGPCHSASCVRGLSSVEVCV